MPGPRRPIDRMARTFGARYSWTMSAALHRLAREGLTLDASERLALAAELIESVEEPDPAWGTAWAAELRRHSAAADGREIRGSEWSDVRARVLAILTKR